MPEDPKKAFTFYMDGARQQDAECFFALGECFRFGIGITQNDVKGFEYYKKDAAMRHAGAQKLVGYCFKNGIGTEVNFLLPFAPEWQQ